jgi:hypothetical protein
LARITPFLAASTTVEQGTVEHTAVAERVRMELETISLTPRVQSDALRLQHMQTQLQKLLCRSRGAPWL